MAGGSGGASGGTSGGSGGTTGGGGSAGSIGGTSGGSVGQGGGTGGGGGTSGGGGGSAGGTQGGAQPFTIVTLDPDGGTPSYLAMAYQGDIRRVGVAYFALRGTQTQPGHDDYDLNYVEWRAGVAQPIETIGFVQRTVGVALAFHPTTGEPTVAYLGGAPGSPSGSSVFWFQSDAVVRSRSGGLWGSESVVASSGSDTVCGNSVSDRGFLVGLWPALTFDSNGTLFFAWRDGHDAQFPQQDWNGSDVELAEGRPGATRSLRCLKAGGNDKQAWGGRIQLALGPGNQPAIVYDQVFGTADGTGNNVIMQRREADGGWTSAATVLRLTDTQAGASVAYDETEGWGIAAVEGATNQLLYVRSTDGVAWSPPDAVHGTGTGGWFPSLAIDPQSHEPAVAHYVCSARTGTPPGSCPAADDRLEIKQRRGTNWHGVEVDPAGGVRPKLGFFAPAPSGPPKRFVVYRDPRTGAVKLAIEN